MLTVQYNVVILLLVFYTFLIIILFSVIVSLDKSCSHIFGMIPAACGLLQGKVGVNTERESRRMREAYVCELVSSSV